MLTWMKKETIINFLKIIFKLDFTNFVIEMFKMKILVENWRQKTTCVQKAFHRWQTKLKEQFKSISDECFIYFHKRINKQNYRRNISSILTQISQQNFLLTKSNIMIGLNKIKFIPLLLELKRDKLY